MAAQDLRTLSHHDLIENIKDLVGNQAKLEVALLRALAEVTRRRLFLMLGYGNLALFCEQELGLSKDAAWKRSQAIRVIEFFPELLELLKAGKTHVSHIAMLAPKITQANSKAILEFLPGKSKRELKGFLGTITLSGQRTEQEELVEMTVSLPKSVFEKLERVMGLCKQGKKQDSLAVEGIERACEAYLEKHDPIRKAERAKKRAACAGASEVKKKPVSPASSPYPSRRPCAGATGRYIPAAVQHAVYLRDQGRCTFVGLGGRRCTETHTLQIDHIKMKCRGGDESVDNLRLMCPAHNRYLAESQGVRTHPR